MCCCGLPVAATPLWHFAQPVVIPAWSNFVPRLLPVVPASGVVTGAPAVLFEAFVAGELEGRLLLVPGLVVAVPFGFACTVALVVGVVAPVGAFEKLLAKFVVRFCWLGAAPCGIAGAVFCRTVVGFAAALLGCDDWVFNGVIDEAPGDAVVVGAPVGAAVKRVAKEFVVAAGAEALGAVELGAAEPGVATLGAATLGAARLGVAALGAAELGAAELGA
jgi:hypothetical protein